MYNQICIRLNAENRFTYLLDRFADGLTAILTSPAKAALVTLYWVAALLLLLHAASPTDSIIGHLMQPLACTLVVLGSIALFVIAITISAIPAGAYLIASAFRRIGLTNSAGEPPLPVKWLQKGERAVLELFTRGIPLITFQDNIEALESALNRRITRIEQGKGKQSILLYLAPGDTQLPEKVYLPQQPPNPTEILLGQSLDGPVTWEPDKVPHLLVGGSTGSGKTTLVKSIISQFIRMTGSDGNPAAEVYVSDLKGGLDYPPRWRTRDCSFATTAGDTLAVSSLIAQELKHREEMYDQVSRCDGVPCSSLEDFNRLRPHNRLRRILFVIDEIAELTDTTGMDKPHKEEAAAIVSNLATIARMGRAFGVHLVVATQRPDAMVVPGQIKSNLDGRICGKADNVLSQIILDKADAADRIPKDSQGLFLDQDGVLFRGYLFDDDNNYDLDLLDLAYGDDDDDDWDVPAEDDPFWDGRLDDYYSYDG